jgi:3-hydroxymyristoyl/3-hydroxydecanoyl-(acyl carrier protein) dehydratase
LLKVRRGIYNFKGTATVDGKLVAEAELKATFADK